MLLKLMFCQIGSKLRMFVMKKCNVMADVHKYSPSPIVNYEHINRTLLFNLPWVRVIN